MSEDTKASVPPDLQIKQFRWKNCYNLERGLDLEKELECPVCLIIPRSPPIFQCRLGHLICSDCHPRLPRPYRSRRCPVCQAKYCNPPTRNFLAERLIECIDRSCRFDFRGCDSRFTDSSSLTSHEALCPYRPKGFKVPKKELSEPGRNTEIFILELLQYLVQLTLGLLVVLILIFFLVSLLTVFLGSSFALIRALNSGSTSSICNFNAPSLLELWNNDLKYKLNHLPQIFNKIYKALKLPKSFITYLLASIKQFYVVWAELQKDHEIEPMICVPSARVTLFYEWPDTFLPSHLDSLVWAPSSSTIFDSKFLLIWNLDDNHYIHGDEIRFGMTYSGEKDVIHSFIRWKLDMKFLSTDCKITGVEMRHGDTLMKNWDSPVLLDTREIVIMAAITGWEKPSVCPEQKFQNVTWTVQFSKESCQN